MLPKPPEPILGSINGEKYISLAEYKVDFSSWLEGLEFIIPKGYVTDRASIPWQMRMAYDRASLGQTAPYLHDLLTNNQGKFTNLDGVEIQLSWFDTHLLFLVAMRLDGIDWATALGAFLAVLAFNRPIWK